jgi:lysozyme
VTATDLIKKHEGLRLKPYRCPAGKLTIGYGTNLDAGITRQEAELLLDMRVIRCRQELRRVFSPDECIYMGKARFDALTDMMYNLGYPTFLEFERMIAAVRAGEWGKAAAEMISSRWAMQVGDRATRLAVIMTTGEPCKT